MGIKVFAASIARTAGSATAGRATNNSFLYMLRHFEETASATLGSPIRTTNPEDDDFQRCS